MASNLLAMASTLVSEAPDISALLPGAFAMSSLSATATTLGVSLSAVHAPLADLRRSANEPRRSLGELQS